jgi:N-formylglutamate amidohydrolase
MRAGLPPGERKLLRRSAPRLMPSWRKTMHPSSAKLPPWVVLHLPHVSTRIPTDVRDQFMLDDDQLAAELKVLTDHFVLDLFLDEACSTPNIRATASRLVVDMERFADDEREPAARHGFGAIYTKTLGGAALRRPLDDEERDSLLARHAAHHTRLAAAVDATLEQCGKCVVLDCHSFPDQPIPFEAEGDGRDRPDICIGTDAFHTPPALARAFVAAFEAQGWTVAVNWPFAGALVPEPFFGRDPRVVGIMIEVNRRICRDEVGVVDGPEHPIAQRVRAVCSDALRGTEQQLPSVSRQETLSAEGISPEAISVFTVHDGNRIEDATTFERETRAEHFEVEVDGWEESPQALALIASTFEPIRWALHPLYEEARDVVDAECDNLTTEVEHLQDPAEGGEPVDEARFANLRKRLAVRRAVLDEMPEDPIDGALDWLRSLDDETFRLQIVPQIQAWLGEPPDWGSYEEDYIPDGATARGAAYVFFRDQDLGTLRTLGVKVIEGDFPGSTYYAAEVCRGIDAANTAAWEHGIPVRFVPAKTVCGPSTLDADWEATVPAEKVRAYSETIYEVAGPRPVCLRIGEANQELATLHNLWGLDTCAFVTACNPRGKASDDAANAGRHARLRHDLQRRRLAFFEGAGGHASNGWPPEPSFLILGLGLDEAREIGVRWEQDAVVWAGADAVARLVLLR